MTPKKLRFRARGTALVQNHERLEAGIKSFIGRKFVQLDAEQWGFDPTGKDEEVAYRAEYVKACKDGDLYPADEATARACGVSFDPTFGVKPAEKTSAKAEKG
jgi:hypothetical protein